MEIYTIGFTQTTAEHFFKRLADARVERLLDVRLNNSSQLAGFAKAKDLPYFLRELVGASYEHEPVLAPTQSACSTRTRSARGTGPVMRRASSLCCRAGGSNAVWNHRTSYAQRRCSAARLRRTDATGDLSASTLPSFGRRSEPFTSDYLIPCASWSTTSPRMTAPRICIAGIDVETLNTFVRPRHRPTSSRGWCEGARRTVQGRGDG